MHKKQTNSNCVFFFDENVKQISAFVLWNDSEEAQSGDLQWEGAQSLWVD